MVPKGVSTFDRIMVPMGARGLVYCFSSCRRFVGGATVLLAPFFSVVFAASPSTCHRIAITPQDVASLPTTAHRIVCSAEKGRTCPLEAIPSRPTGDGSEAASL